MNWLVNILVNLSGESTSCSFVLFNYSYAHCIANNQVYSKRTKSSWSEALFRLLTVHTILPKRKEMKHTRVSFGGVRYIIRKIIIVKCASVYLA